MYSGLQDNHEDDTYLLDAYYRTKPEQYFLHTVVLTNVNFKRIAVCGQCSARSANVNGLSLAGLQCIFAHKLSVT